MTKTCNARSCRTKSNLRRGSSRACQNSSGLNPLPLFQGQRSLSGNCGSRQQDPGRPASGAWWRRCWERTGQV